MNNQNELAGDRAASLPPRRSPLRACLSLLHAPIYETRLRKLVELISPQVKNGDHILDVGCGSGQLGYRLATYCRDKDVTVIGLEKSRRGDEPIAVETYGVSGRFPFADGSFDIVLIADVLHHEENEEQLLKECIRVSRRTLIIKDHKIDGLLAYPRTCLIDWAANAPYGVKCLYRYHTSKEWSDLLRGLGLEMVRFLDSIDLYPRGINQLFGGRLQYFAVTRVPSPAASERRKDDNEQKDDTDEIARGIE